MRDKEQKVKYIDGRWCDTINECYLNNGWYVVMIVPATTKTQTGAYVVLEREKEAPQISENLIDTFTNIGIALYDNKGEIKSLNQILKEISQKWEELIIYDK
jgi:hypothetical protein